MKFWTTRGGEPTPDQIRARVQALKSSWAAVHAEAEALRRAGVYVCFRRNGLGDPYTKPGDFRAELDVSVTEKL